MSEEVVPAEIQENPPEKQKMTINIVQLLDLSCGVLNQLLIRQPAAKSKKLFKALKQGDVVSVGAVSLSSKKEAAEQSAAKQEEGASADQDHKISLSVALDYSEFRGPGFSHPLFLDALKGMLHQIATTMRAKQDLNIMTNEAGAMLVHKPGVVKLDDQYNVMVLSVEPVRKSALVLKLMFVDPSQYEAVRREEE